MMTAEWYSDEEFRSCLAFTRSTGQYVPVMASPVNQSATVAFEVYAFATTQIPK